MDAKFALIVDHFKARDYKDLSLEEKLLFIDSLSRTAQGNIAIEKMGEILADYPKNSSVLATAGTLYFSQGRINKAEEYVESAFAIEKDSRDAILAKLMLSLHFRKFVGAEKWYEKLVRIDPEWRKSYLYYLLGIEVYSAARNLRKLSILYKKRAEMFKKSDKSQFRSLISSSNLLRGAVKKPLFNVEGNTEKIAMPFAADPQDAHQNTIYLIKKGKRYRVLLDTANSAGWIIHNSELRELLRSKKGGRALAEIGTEMGVMDGYFIHSKKVDFGNFKIDNMIGLYVPKPRPDFYDANLNPAFIRNRVVTIDYINKQMILRTKERFEQDLNSLHPKNHFKFPWYGYRYTYIPVTIEGKSGLALIETGAEDIAIKLDFAKKLLLPLKQNTKYLADGKTSQYHETRIKLLMGKYLIERKVAEVWPFDRFYDRISGLSADIIIGPKAFIDNFALSLDPFDKKIILRGFSPSQ